MATAQSVLTLALCILMITELILAEKNFYEILGVPKDANERQIKKAFHKLAMRFHPDRNKSPNAEAKFREIAEAYETLSDDKRRQEYDQMGPRASFEGTKERGGRQPFSFNFDDMFRDSDAFGQNQHFQHTQQKRNFQNHFQNHQREAQSRHGRHFQNSFGEGVFDDIFENMEKMFSFDMPGADDGFHRSTKQHCRTVTQRRGNMVTTYTDCS
ncbi:dnaJ homolog subfamily B member 9 [Clupea harengus]|uniref:DnaJ homolog subfamily B member 9 n=1 Tax=Clupea harengus TaxID=7950 RepID=A0A6P3VZN0_CLUHA|nr:dnaJ homolog subfamily B member 9 [Clupea harengus]